MIRIEHAFTRHINTSAEQYVSHNQEKKGEKRMKKTLTAIIIGLLCVSTFPIFAPQVKAEGIYTDFESGLGGWQPFIQYGGTAQLSTTHAHSGTHSVEQSGHSSGSDPYSSVGRIHFPVTSILNQYELSAWVYATERSDANAASFFGFVFNWPEGTPPELREVVGWGPWGSGSSYVHVRQSEGYTPKGNWYNPVPYGLSLNTWHQVKVIVYANLGTVSIWLDGSLIVDNWPAFNAGEKPDYYDIECSANYYGTYVMHQYVDDVHVSETERPPVGYWKFDEGSGTSATDSSGNGNTGTLHGPQWVDGIKGKALKFDGVNDYVHIPNSPSLDVSGNEISVEYWVNFPRGWYPGIPIGGDYTHGHIVFDKGDAYTACFYDTTGTHVFNIPYVPPYPASNKNTWDANTWYHIADVFDGSQIRMYVNGILDKVETVIGSVSRSSINLAIGSHCYGGMRFFEGIIDEFAIYNYARTSEEVWNDYASVKVSLPWRDEFDYNTKEEMKSAGWILDEEVRISVGGGLLTLDNDGVHGCGVKYMGHFLSGVNDFRVEAKSKWIGRSYGSRVFYVWTQRHRYGWQADGYYPEYAFIRYSDGWSGSDDKVLRFGGYEPAINEWATMALEKRGNTFYMYQDGQLKNTYTEADSAPDELVGVSISGCWLSTVQYDYISVTMLTAPQPDFEISVTPDYATADPHSTTEFEVVVTSSNGFNQPITLSAVYSSHELSGSFEDTVVTPPSDGTVTTTLKVSVLSEALNTHQIYVTGTSGSLGHVETATLNVPFISVPYFSQGDTKWCFPTSVAMAMNYFGVSKHPWEIANDLLLDHEASGVGLTQWLLYQYLLQNGLNYDLTGLIVNKENLVSMLGRNEPILLNLISIQHTVVITGYSAASDCFFVNDPSGFLINKVYPTKTPPFIQINISWDSLKTYAMQLRNYAIGINQGIMGCATPSRGSLDITGGDILTTMSFRHGDPLYTAKSNVSIWSSGYVLPFSPYSPGLAWRNYLHSSTIDPNDYFVLILPLVINPTDKVRSYQLEILFESPSYETSISLNVDNVDPCSNSFAWVPKTNMRGVLGGHYGVYTLSLALFNDRQLIDLVDLPKIKYVPQIRVTLHSPANLHVTDPNGQSIGYDPDTGQSTNEILDAFYSGVGMEPQEIMIPDPTDGTYSITLVGTATGDYTLTIECITAEQTLTQTFNGAISPQEKQNFASAVSETTLKLHMCASVDAKPDTLNLASRATWVTAYIELPKSISLSHINVSSIRLNGTIPADLSEPATIGDYDNDGLPDLMIKFDRAAVQRYILDNVPIEAKSMTTTLTVTGKLNDGTLFQGIDTIKITFPGNYWKIIYLEKLGIV